MKDFELKYLIVDLLPTFLRVQRLFSFICSLITPIETIKADFFTNRRKNIAEANQTGQVCLLEGLLNNTFDTELRRIEIVDGNASDWTILWRKDIIENDPTPETLNYNTDQILILLGKCDTITTSPGKNLYVYNNDNTGVHLVSKQGEIGSSGYDFTIRIPNAIKPLSPNNKKSFESQMISLVNKYKLVSKRYNLEYYE